MVKYCQHTWGFNQQKWDLIQELPLRDCSAGSLSSITWQSSMNIHHDPPLIHGHIMRNATLQLPFTCFQKVLVKQSRVISSFQALLSTNKFLALLKTPLGVQTHTARRGCHHRAVYSPAARTESNRVLIRNRKREQVVFRPPSPSRSPRSVSIWIVWWVAIRRLRRPRGGTILHNFGRAETPELPADKDKAAAWHPQVGRNKAAHLSAAQIVRRRFLLWSKTHLFHSSLIQVLDVDEPSGNPEP